MGQTTTHRDVLRRLSAAEKRSLTARSDVRGLVHLAGHLGIIVVFLGLNLTSDGWVKAGAVLGQGIAMVFLFTAMHECSHATAFRSRWLNLAVGIGAGMMLLISPRWFFHFHQDHHRFTQDPARDPELSTPKPATMGGYAWYLSGVPFWCGNLKVLVGNAMAHRRDPYVPLARRAAVVREARLMLLAYTVILAWLAITGLLVTTLLLPLLVGQPFLRAYLLAEHAGCEETSGDMLANTRTLLTTAPVRFLSWNMPFHTEHHSFPAVPFHALPRLHRVMRDDVRHLEPGYLSFHREFSGRLSPPSREG
ncbi:MAG: fatty acid desaturase [Pseudomonadota bacterium]|nr:fatty acid desaturase [Pseudomonadota bacterium]MEC8130283.1 fatty acid desaturase [Pseudomonadota bacterium]